VLAITGGLLFAPAAQADNDTHFIIPSTTWRYDLALQVGHGDKHTNPPTLCQASHAERDGQLSPDDDGRLTVNSTQRVDLCSTTLTSAHNWQPQVTGQLTGKKIDLDGTENPVTCTFTVTDPSIGSMDLTTQSDCAASGVNVELSSGFGWGLFNDYAVTFNLVGKPRMPLKMASTAAEVGAAARASDDCIKGTPGDDTIVGTPGDDCIIAGPGDDVIDGRGGNDTILAGPGDDTIKGGEGDDTILAGSGDDTIDPGSGEDFVNGATGTDTVITDNDDEIDVFVDSQNQTVPTDDEDDMGRVSDAP
jgi:Ca2+-binding RTX toxin-like protein